MSKIEDDDYKRLEEEINKLESIEDDAQERWTARRAMVGAMLTNFCVGSYFLYGNYNALAANWIKEKDPSIEPKNTLLVQPIWLMCQTVITTIGVKLADKFGFRTVIYCSLFGYCMINLITSYCQQYWLFVAVYGIGSGCFLGLGYLLSLYIAWTYYPNSKSIVTGMVLFATGSCPAILAPVTTLIVNPDGKKAHDPQAYGNIPKMFRMLSIAYGVILLLVMLVLPPPKKSLEMKRKTLMKKLGHGEEEHVTKEQDIEQFLKSGEEQNKKDLEEIENIDVEDSPIDSPNAKRIGSGGGFKKNRLDPAKGDSFKIQSLHENNNLIRIQTMKDSRKMSGTYRNSIAFLQTQQVFSDIQNMISSESMVLMQGMSAKYMNNLQSLHKEQEDHRRRTMGFQERKRFSERRTISAQKNLKVLRESLMRAKETNKNIAEIMPRETIAKIVTENADEMDPEVVEEIADQLIQSQCPDMMTGIKHPNFAILVIMCIGSTVYNFFMNAAWKEFIAFTEIKVDPNQESLMLTIASVFEAGSGLIAGAMLLFIPFKYFYLAQVSIQVIALLSVTYLAKSYLTVTIYISLSMYFLGSDKTVFPTITQKIFGPIAGPKIYPFVYVFFAVSSLLQFVVYNFITDDFKTIFVVFTVMGVLAFVATLFLNMKPTWVKRDKDRATTLTKRFLREPNELPDDRISGDSGNGKTAVIEDRSKKNKTDLLVVGEVNPIVEEDATESAMEESFD